MTRNEFIQQAALRIMVRIRKTRMDEGEIRYLYNSGESCHAMSKYYADQIEKQIPDVWDDEDMSDVEMLDFLLSGNGVRIVDEDGTASKQVRTRSAIEKLMT